MIDYRLDQLHRAGVSIWLDHIERGLIRNGELEHRIHEQNLLGQTSNPSLFEAALSHGTEYDAQIRDAAGGLTTTELLELVEVTDVREACDVFRPVYDRTRGADGYVSIEVSPGVAADTEETVREARRLWAAVDRPNAMVKIPGTDAGVRAVQRCIADGINVNITLLFSVEVYRRVIHAYMAGLETRIAGSKDVAAVTSVASFFVSRVDTEVDRRVDALLSTPNDRRHELERLKGRAAVANAKRAFQLYQREFTGARWRALQALGGRVQRPLWASMGTKNPAYRDVLYVEELIGPHVVMTLPPATLAAFADHGMAQRTVDRNVEEAEAALVALENAGISMEEVAASLLRDGLEKFERAVANLRSGLEQKVRRLS
jgi:transaldolase